MATTKLATTRAADGSWLGPGTFRRRIIRALKRLEWTQAELASWWGLDTFMSVSRWVRLRPDGLPVKDPTRGTYDHARAALDKLLELETLADKP